MNTARRLVATLTASVLAAGGFMVASAAAATAAPACVSDGISREVGPNGVPIFRNNAACGELYDYEVRRTSTPKPPTRKPTPTTGGCLTGIVGDIACDRPRQEPPRSSGGGTVRSSTIHVFHGIGGFTRTGVVTVYEPITVETNEK